MSVTPQLTDEQARDAIRALSIAAREHAGVYKSTGDQEALAQSKRLDSVRFVLEKATDDVSEELFPPPGDEEYDTFKMP